MKLFYFDLGVPVSKLQFSSLPYMHAANIGLASRLGELLLGVLRKSSLLY